MLVPNFHMEYLSISLGGTLLNDAFFLARNANTHSFAFKVERMNSRLLKKKKIITPIGRCVRTSNIATGTRCYAVVPV